MFKELRSLLTRSHSHSRLSGPMISIADLPLGFVRCKPDGTIVSFNKVFAGIMGISNEAGRDGLNFREFYPAAVLYDMQISQLLTSASISFGRVSFINARGEELSCRLNGFLGRDERGEPCRADFVVEDSSRELILENKLMEAQKLETIGALAGGIAHDFNNILATISGYSEMLTEDLPADSEAAEMVARIRGSVVRAQSLIGQILTFSRHIEQEKIPVNVQEILEETLGFMGPSVPHNVLVKSSFGNNESRVLADPTQLFRVFLNLMTNALQSMEETGGTLTVSVDRADGYKIRNDEGRAFVADEYVLIRFADTGKGMDQSVLSRIFEPFYTTRDAGSGTGLGLSVTHGIVRELAGDIRVNSSPGKGSEFLLYLPLAQGCEEKTATEGARKRILFITGNSHESKILSIAMKGYDLFYISDRQELANVLGGNEGAPDAILYMSETTQVTPDDLLMLYRQMKLRIPFILISGSETDLFGEKLLNSGIVNQHLIRPVSLKELSASIRTAVDR